MQLNPYESPRVPQPGQEQELADSNSVRQLLVEIRDGQRELLQLQREALKAQGVFKRFAAVRMLVPLLIFGGVIASSFYLQTTMIRPRPVVPPTAPMPRAVPRTTPAPRGGTVVVPSGDKAAD
ncbi:MAG TPA: hypothetical protein VGI40_00895 [Pirellulaceae bacterium]|jgi:hypothetical protein